MIKYDDYSFLKIVVRVLPSHGSAVGPVFLQMAITALLSGAASLISYHYCDWLGIHAHLPPKDLSIATWLGNATNGTNGTALAAVSSVVRSSATVVYGNMSNLTNTTAGPDFLICGPRDRWQFRFSNHGHLLIQVAMSFLLVFRSSISYGRYWAGRGTLGDVVKRCRDLARQLSTYAPGEEIDNSLRYVKVFFPLLTLHLRRETDLTKQIELLLSGPGEIAQMKRAKARRPLVVIAWLSREVRTLRMTKKLTKWEYMAVEENISELISGFNGVDKIRFTQIPFPYAQLLQVLLCGYCFSVPFTLVQNYHMFTFVPCTILTLALFAINEVGVQIEDPFGDDPNDLPMGGMEAAIMQDTNMYKALGQLSTFDARTSRGFLAEQRKCDRDDAVGLEASMP